MSLIIFTNNALRKMAKWAMSESQVRDAYRKGTVETFKDGYTSISKYPGYEIGVYWVKAEEGKIKIISVWKRGRR